MKMLGINLRCKNCNADLIMEGVVFIEDEDGHVYIGVGGRCVMCNYADYQEKYFSLEDVVLITKGAKLKEKFEKPEAEA